MAVRIRMKRFGRRHRPFYRVCAVDQRAPRNGRVIEELGTYDPLVPEVDARAVLNPERIQYWLGVGAQPSDKVRVLIKKYGPEGTHLDEQRAALDRLAVARKRPEPIAVAPKSAPAEATVEETSE
ncbi:MAG: 30S ribosomal protein S16 [Pirellulales bacterium]|nr:30S ribosomal protein S16 [Pirellulales bacterium]